MSQSRQVKSAYLCKDFSDISKCFDKLDSKISGEIASLKENVCSITTVVEKIEKTVDTHEATLEYVMGEMKILHEETIPNLEARLESEKNERIALELWGRKWNLVVRGIPGNVKEPSRDTQLAVRGFLKNTLGVPAHIADTMLFQAIHRLPNGPQEKRNIIVRFVSLQDRDQVLNLGFKIKPGSGFAVVPDLPPSLAQLRYELLGKRRSLPEGQRRKTKLVYLKAHPFLKLTERD